MIDEPTLDRKAEPPSGAFRKVEDADATTVFDPTPTGSTIALPIGLNEPIFATVEAELIEDDPDAVAPASNRPRRTLWVVAVVTALLLLLGLGAWWYNTQGPGAYTVVPSVTDQTSEAAQAILSTAGLGTTVLSDYSDEVPVGIVIRTTPAAQARIAKNDTVKIVVSQGPRMAIVPNVVGITEGDATNQLAAAGFAVGTTDKVYSDTVPSGEVMSTDPVAAASVRHDIPVNMVASQGPEPITIPDLKGVTEAQAKSQLAAYAMVVTTETVRTVDVNKGEVLKTDPAAGSASTRTARIILYVSIGKPQVQVPNFIQLTVAQAQAQADSLGLILDITPQWGYLISGPKTDNKNIAAQTPNLGVLVEVGTTVHLQYN
jgi:serine/threonine-protein kinase